MMKSDSFLASVPENFEDEKEEEIGQMKDAHEDCVSLDKNLSQGGAHLTDNASTTPFEQFFDPSSQVHQRGRSNKINTP